MKISCNKEVKIKRMKTMSRLAYHFGLVMRFYPSSKQKQMIKVNYDAQRFVYNQYIGINSFIYHVKKYLAIKQRQCVPFATNLLTKEENELAQVLEHKQWLIAKPKNLRDEYNFLRNKMIDSMAIANSIQNYHKAWKNYHKIGSGSPQFHKKSNLWAYQTNSHYSNKENDAYLDNANIRFIDTKHIKLPKLGIIRISGFRKLIKERLLNHIPTRIGTVTIKKSPDNKYFVSLQLASDIPFVKALPKTGSRIGIDLNLDNFLTESNGAMVENPRYYHKRKKKLAYVQRIMSRKIHRAKSEGRSLRTAKNYQKQCLLVAKLHEKVMRQRKNFLHYLSIILVKSHDLIVAEELRSKNMMKNHALSQAISDAGWKSFLNMLAYKAELYGKNFMTVDPKYTTQRCHNCGTIMGHNGYDKLTLKDREWTCPVCGNYHIRDWNAAINILEKGQRIWSNEKAV